MFAMRTREAPPVEDVQVEGGGDRVADRVLLIQESGRGAGFDVVPRAPLVDDQPHPSRRIVPIHDGAVAGEQLVHETGPADRLVP